MQTCPLEQRSDVSVAIAPTSNAPVHCHSERVFNRLATQTRTRTLTVPMPRTSVSMRCNSPSSASSNFLVDRLPLANRPARSRTAHSTPVNTNHEWCRPHNRLTVFSFATAQASRPQSCYVLGDNLVSCGEEVGSVIQGQVMRSDCGYIGG